MPATPSNQSSASVHLVPDLAKLRVLLEPHGRDTFTGQNACPTGTLGSYLEMLYTNGTPNGDGEQHELTGGCGPFPQYAAVIDPPADAAYWYCRIESSVRGAEPWHYELRIRVRKSDLDLDFATMTCPGSP